MRIGINEVIIRERSSGTRQRELNILPELLRQIRAAGAEAIIYVSRDLDSKLVQKLIGDSAPGTVVRTPLPAVPTYQRLLTGMFYWRRRVIQDRLDLFHTSYFPPPRLPIPVVLTVNDLRFFHLPNTYQKSRLYFLRLTVPPFIKRASRIVTISEDTKVDLVRHLRVKDAKIDVVHIPVGNMFRPIKDAGVRSTIRRKYSLPERYIIFVGHLEPRKNLQRLAQAFLHLRIEKRINHSLLLLGKQSFRFRPILRELANVGLSDKLVFASHVPDEEMPAFYSMADVLAFPSLHEGFGLPVLEAMACGTPVVTSNVAALPEVAGDAAILVNPYSVRAIAEGLYKVLTDPKLKDHLIAKGIERAKTFTAEKAASKLWDTYRRALDTK